MKIYEGWRIGGKIWVLICFFISIMMVLNACSTVMEGIAGRPEIFRSQDYMVYMAGGNENSNTLAKKLLGDAAKAWLIEDNNPSGSFRRGQAVVIPLKEENVGGLYEDGIQIVPILCYHRFGKTCRSNLCISERIFAKQLEYLKNNGYHTIQLRDLIKFLNYETAIPSKSVIITLDDGYRSIYEFAYPLLKRYGYTATLFIYTDFIEASSNALTWNQLRKLKAAGFEIGSHSLSHADLTKKLPFENDQTFRNRITNELIQSKKIIDRELNQDTQFFAYPYGNYNQQVLDLFPKAGYKLGLTIRYGGNSFVANPLTLKRSQILEENMAYFKDRIQILHPISLR
ncbi:MAG: polysaccharide deacetylase family protein [Desulfobacterales bacterium]